MSATLLFVHGTGVREAAYAATLRLISTTVERMGLPATVRGCFWGGAAGATLAADGMSIPNYHSAGGHPPTEADQLMAVWSVLYTDPWYELRLLRNLPTARSGLIGQEPPAVLFTRALTTFVPSARLTEALATADLEVEFDDALTALRAAPEFQQAAATAPADPLDHRRAVARALIAYAMVAAEEKGAPPLDGATRDALVLELTSELHGYGMGVGDFLLRPFKGVAQWMITRKLTGDRGGISDAAAPAAGDILRYLAHGDPARTLIRQAIADAGPGPVHLLAHSLGGIMCTDLLATEAIPSVATLVTAGSQAPFMYEIGALPSLTYPAPLPGHFPPWLNFFDPRDLLSYLGAPLFGATVRDIQVDNGQPFPQSHSAYWSNRSVWAEIAKVLS